MKLLGLTLCCLVVGEKVSKIPYQSKCVPVISDVDGGSDYKKCHMDEVEQRHINYRKRKGQQYLGDFQKWGAEEWKFTSFPSGVMMVHHEVPPKVDLTDRPTKNDIVVLKYSVANTEGQILENRLEGEGKTLTMHGCVEGLAEALLTMVPGQQSTVAIPYNLGYGSRGAGKTIKPYQTLVYFVHLLKVLRRPEQDKKSMETDQKIAKSRAKDLSSAYTDKENKQQITGTTAGVDPV